MLHKITAHHKRAPMREHGKGKQSRKVALGVACRAFICVSRARRCCVPMSFGLPWDRMNHQSSPMTKRKRQGHGFSAQREERRSVGGKSRPIGCRCRDVRRSDSHTSSRRASPTRRSRGRAIRPSRRPWRHDGRVRVHPRDVERCRSNLRNVPLRCRPGRRRRWRPSCFGNRRDSILVDSREKFRTIAARKDFGEGLRRCHNQRQNQRRSMHQSSL